MSDVHYYLKDWKNNMSVKLHISGLTFPVTEGYYSIFGEADYYVTSEQIPGDNQIHNKIVFKTSGHGKTYEHPNI